MVRNLPAVPAEGGSPGDQPSKEVFIDSKAKALAGDVAQPRASLHFDFGRGHSCEGELRAGGRLAIHYDQMRLPDCRGYQGGMPCWELFAYVRFQPGSQLYSGSVVRHLTHDGEAIAVPPASVPYELTIPAGTTRMEVWFQNIDAGGCVAWDTNGGEKYSWSVLPGASTVPPDSVGYRWGAKPSRDVVNVIAEAATKKNHHRDPQGHGRDLRARLVVMPWVRNLAYEKHVWVDVHVFDPHDELLHAETLPLHYVGPAAGDGDFFELDQVVYEGSRATSGSAFPRPDARKVQYRLYCEVGGNVYTDGILHQHELSEDVFH